MKNYKKCDFYFAFITKRTHCNILSSLILCVFCLSSFEFKAQISQQFTTNGTFTVPANITSIKVECIGGGGKGSNAIGVSSGYGGGGGGAYASSTFDVAPGDNYSVLVGSGGINTTATAANGGDSSFGSTLVLAKGGSGLTTNITTGATGGTAASSVGEIKFSGGNGGNNSEGWFGITFYYSGGGGGGAGSTGTGNNAVDTAGGATKLNCGGAGGAGVTASLLGSATGIAGGNYGAGGSGASRYSSNVNGGNGASGLVVITYQDLTCSVSGATTWNGTAWSNGLPSITKKAIINADYNTTSKGSFTACSCTVNAGKTLTIGNGTAGDYIELQNELTNNGTVVVNNNASLIQNNSISNIGVINLKRTAKPMKRYDFTYWSSPVSPQTLYNLSPTTLGDKYYSWNSISQGWVIHYNGAENMISGKGYIVRAPQSFPINAVNPTDFVGTFVGVPNNGNISLNVNGNLSAVTTDFKWNLIGNPYPSAVNLNKFLTDNATKINGTVYLWTHNSPPSNAIPGDAVYNYTASDYAAFNLLGGTATSAATVNPLHPIINPSPNTNVPNGFLASGQSFFVKGKADATVKFTNDMREKTGNNQFFRQSNASENLVEKNRFWLNLRNAEGAFHQTLVGYIDGATNDFEDNYDGELFGGNYVSIYSLGLNKQLTIQGRALPFENSDTVPLGLTTTIAGDFSISLDNFEGLFLDQDIFLKDNLLHVTHNLKTGGYPFTVAIGTFNDRFEIVYQNESLGIKNPEFNSNAIIVYKKDKSIVVNSGLLMIDNIQVFDIQGRLLYDGKNINSSETIIKDLPGVDQVLIVKVQTSEGNKVSKKIIY